MRLWILRLAAALTFMGCGIAAAQESPEPLLQQAIKAHRGGDLEGAIRGYRAYLKARPEAVDARSNLGAALAATGRYAEAIIEYGEALKRSSPKNLPVRLNLALAYYKSDQIRKAAGELETLHRAQPANKQVVLLLADCWLRQGDDARVIALLTPVERQDEGDLAAAYMLGTALLRNKQMEEGQRRIDRILRRGDSAEARLMMGTAKLNAMEFQEALVDLRKAVELNPNLPELHSYLGRAEMESGDPAAARTAFEKELAHNPVDFEANLNLAVLLKQSEDYDGARRLLAKALQVRPGELRALYQVGAIELTAGSLEKARATFEAVIREAPQFIEAHISLATAYYRLKRKADGDRERALVQKLKAEQDARNSRGQVQ